MTDYNEVSTIATDYFRNLFSATEVSANDRLFGSVTPYITEDLNRELMTEFKAKRSLGL